MIFEIRTVDKLRYSSVGDYFEEDGRVIIEVFNQQDDDRSFLVGIHELLEQHLTKRKGITNEQIDEFDFEYEKNRSPEDTTSEPGNHPDCPYRDAHRFSEIVEQMVCRELGIDWNEYSKNIKVYEPPTEG